MSSQIWTKFSLIPITGKVDLKYLACQHHLVMVEELEQHVKHNPDLESVLVLGLGGGALCTYLHQKFPSLSIEGVDIDSTMVDLAKRYFGFNPDDNLKAHVADGLVFIRDTVASGAQVISPNYILFHSM